MGNPVPQSNGTVNSVMGCKDSAVNVRTYTTGEEAGMGGYRVGATMRRHIYFSPDPGTRSLPQGFLSSLGTNHSAIQYVG